jgi:ADP-heptose:LPS heptosyltransferase
MQNKIVFFHMNQLGDFMFSLPLLAAAKQQWPDAERISVIRPPLAPLLEATGLMTSVISRPKAGLREKWALTQRLKQTGFSKAVLFSESPEVTATAYFAGVPERIGFTTASLRWLLTKTAPRTGVPSLRNNAALAQVAGLSQLLPHYAGLVKIPQSQHDAIYQWLQKENIAPSQLVVVSPGASKRRKHKFWLHYCWRELLGRMISVGITPVVCGAPAEKEELEELVKVLKHSVKVFSAPNGILSLAALFAAAKCFVGIDSGAMHLAAGVGTPVVGLFGPTDPMQIGPQPLEKHRIIKKQFMKDITVEDVWKEVNAQLK